MENDLISEVSSPFTVGNIKRRVRGKNGVQKITKWNTSLASKIKTKTISNSSLFKTSLKLNNKALAKALSAEKEHSQRLKNEKLLLQKEVDGLHLQNVLLCQKLNCLNKSLVKIEAFLNNHLLTAIEVSTLSEEFQKPLQLKQDQCHSSSQQCEISDQQIRSVRQHKDAIYIGKHDKKPQDVVKEVSISKKTTANHINTELLVSEEQIPKSSKTNETETMFVPNTFSKENRSCVDQISHSTFIMDLDSVRECERQSKLHNSLFPVHVTERKKNTVPHISTVKATFNDFHIKINQSNMFHYSSGKITTSESSNQINPSDASHSESSSQFRNETIDTNKLCFQNDQKPEETVYDTDMELTASELGEILLIKSKASAKNTNMDKAGNISVNLRKVKNSNAEKQMKDKQNSSPKKLNEKVLNKTQIKNIRATEYEKFGPLERELLQCSTNQEVKLRCTNEHVPVEYSGISNKTDNQMHLEQTVYLNCQQQTTDVLQAKKNEDMISETSEITDDECQKQGIIPVSDKILLESCHVENLNPVESNLSDAMSSEQVLEVKERKCSAVPKINKLNYNEMESDNYLRTNSVDHRSQRCRSDYQATQNQKTNMKSGCRNGKITTNHNATETITQSFSVPETDQMSTEFSHINKRRIAAKASRKTYIVYPVPLNRKRSSEIHDENKYTNIRHNRSEEIRRNDSIQNVRTSHSEKRETQLCAERFQKRIDSTSKPKAYVICSQGQDTNTKEAVSNNTETITEFTKISKTFSILDNPETMQNYDLEKKSAPGKMVDIGIKPLQELTNTGVNSASKPKKELEKNSTPPVRRSRGTICYKEPKINSKLRRGDEFTDVAFLDGPVFKVKHKQSFKSKSRLS